MKESVVSVLKNWKNFSGRASRSEFWYFVLASAILGAIVGGIELATGLISIENPNATGPLSSILNLLLAIPSISVTSRRLQDYGYSGWWQLSYITVIGIFVVLIWCMLPAKEDENDWGKNPLLES
ncbi:DUF805 domain-containing protein [Gammaproteobacteria bacterium]|jgi:uncharacterized membrane protein YhaH (DUF805 family)|nr:DUF805 domain-containing protein [Gammaproteobacteria bacterium]MDG1948099.1 DUF805 domain-containing protein [SAR86 cluster bacterium]MDG2092462.1 DUF805 domain-containing protein [SAR86 cluster bacterium]|tara:strand:- start:995 stop:1369 length:375 start_codon:yes stop_codon:yes gene_type:complete